MSRVVIADDHSFFRTGLESVLARSGFEVVAAVGDGASALTAIEQFKPDLVILDVRMPEKDGIETLREIRSNGRKYPVILLAAEFEDDALLGAINAGADALVSKGSSDKILLEAMSAVQSGAQYLEHGYLNRFLELSSGQPPSVPRQKAQLSEKELLVAQAVAEGMKNRQIAEQVGLSEAMVKLYLHRIYARLGLANRTELALFIRDSDSIQTRDD